MRSASKTAIGGESGFSSLRDRLLPTRRIRGEASKSTTYMLFMRVCVCVCVRARAHVCVCKYIYHVKDNNCGLRTHYEDLERFDSAKGLVLAVDGVEVDAR